MSVNVTLQFHGERKLVLKFERLKLTTRTTILMAAAKAAAKPMREAVRRMAPRRPGSGGGTLRREIRSGVQGSTPNSATVAVGWRRGKASRTPAFYGLFVDQGTARRTRKDGGDTGRVVARNFLRLAFETERGASEKAAAAVLLAAITKAVR